jgi:ankyrin repeat protein
MVQILLDYTADVNGQTYNNWTPMHYVSQGSQSLPTPHNIPRLLPDVVRLLLEHGADINAWTDGGLTPLQEAARMGRVEVVRVLEHGANVGAKGNEGRTPFEIASANEDDDMMKLLSVHGQGRVVA